MKIIRFLASTSLAAVMAYGLEAALPDDIPRITVIMLAGVVAIFWSSIDDVISGTKP